MVSIFTLPSMFTRAQNSITLHRVLFLKLYRASTQFRAKSQSKTANFFRCWKINFFAWNSENVSILLCCNTSKKWNFFSFSQEQSSNVFITLYLRLVGKNVQWIPPASFSLPILYYNHEHGAQYSISSKKRTIYWKMYQVNEEGPWNALPQKVKLEEAYYQKVAEKGNCYKGPTQIFCQAYHQRHQ